MIAHSEILGQRLGRRSRHGRRGPVGGAQAVEDECKIPLPQVGRGGPVHVER